MANLKSPVTFTLKVTVTGMADEASTRGNYGMRGVTVETLDVSGCDAGMIGAFAPNGGNGSQIALYFAPEGVKRSAPKAPVALPKKSATKRKAKPEAGSDDDELIAKILALKAQGLI
jgi:outer membrane protein assembly factor BamE (lipoprotein component of BamABCDE complex)